MGKASARLLQWMLRLPCLSFPRTSKKQQPLSHPQPHLCFDCGMPFGRCGLVHDMHLMLTWRLKEITWRWLVPWKNIPGDMHHWTQQRGCKAIGFLMLCRKNQVHNFPSIFLWYVVNLRNRKFVCLCVSNQGTCNQKVGVHERFNKAHHPWMNSNQGASYNTWNMHILAHHLLLTFHTKTHKHK